MKKPVCKRIRRKCRELDVTIKIADFEGDTRKERDDAATWITGHHERVSFGEVYRHKDDLLVDATIHVPCRYLKTHSANGSAPSASCSLYGFKSDLPGTNRTEPPVLDHGDGSFLVVRKGKRRPTPLAKTNGIEPTKKKNKGRQLPVVSSPNPCAEAACKTSDHTQGAACCRDLKLEVFVPKGSRNRMALLKTRKSPYLCKVKRENKHLVEVEVISACGYLGDDGITCVLHDRRRPNGKKAKPQLCYDWPDFGEDETGHPGCVFA